MCFLLLDGPIQPTPLRFVFIAFVFAVIPEIVFAIAGNPTWIPDKPRERVFREWRLDMVHKLNRTAVDQAGP